LFQGFVFTRTVVFIFWLFNFESEEGDFEALVELVFSFSSKPVIFEIRVSLSF